MQAFDAKQNFTDYDPNKAKLNLFNRKFCLIQTLYMWFD